MSDTMRGVYTNLTKIRRDVFREVAKVCYSMGDDPTQTDADLDKRFDELPFKILPGDVATYRESVFLERAIIAERIRLPWDCPSRGRRAHAHLGGIHPDGRPLVLSRRWST